MRAVTPALVVSAVAEAATGLALLLAPSLVGRLLLGVELTGVAALVARLAGIALIALGIACWPGTPLRGMLIYNAAATVFLAATGAGGGFRGVLLWPVVAVHLIVTLLLVRDFVREGAPTS